jgi:hypothetical protein
VSLVLVSVHFFVFYLFKKKDMRRWEKGEEIEERGRKRERKGYRKGGKQRGRDNTVLTTAKPMTFIACPHSSVHLAIRIYARP